MGGPDEPPFTMHFTYSVASSKAWRGSLIHANHKYKWKTGRQKHFIFQRGMMVGFIRLGKSFVRFRKSLHGIGIYVVRKTKVR